MENSQDYIIKEWLETCPIIKEIASEISIETVNENIKSIAIQRTGFDNLPLKYITDKGWRREYYYTLLLKNESEIDIQKLLNFDWLDKLSDWLSDKNRKKEFPALSVGKIENVECANSLTYEQSEDGSISDYTLQINFIIRKEQ